MQKFKTYELKIALLITSGFVIKRAYDSLKHKILQLESRVTKLEYPIHSSKRRTLFRQGSQRILKVKPD